MSNKEKCFEYFNSNKGREKGDLIKGVVSKFGITRLTAENYYSKWKGENSLDEVAEEAASYIFGEDEGKEVEKKEEKKEEKKIVPEIGEKEKKEQAQKEKEWDEKVKSSLEKAIKPCKEPEIKELKKARRLKIVRLDGEKLSFSIKGEWVTLYTPQGKNIDVKIEDLEDIMAEIREFLELREVIK